MILKFPHERKFYLLTVLLLVVFFLSISFGNVSISMEEIFQILTGRSENQTAKNILLFHRLPRSMAAVFTGFALPVSGWMLQEYFRNPLAGPSVLGITSASSLGVAVVILLGSVMGFNLSQFGSVAVIAAAFIGALLAALLILVFSEQLNSSNALIIMGFMISALCGAMIGILEFIAGGDQIKSYILWGFGSLNGLSWNQLLWFAIILLIGLGLSFQTIRRLAGLMLGEEYGTTMGIHVKNTRNQIVISASLLTAVATALVGPIAFIGLAVPHFCRILLRTADFYRLFWFTAIVGMISMLVFSMISEWFPGGVLPVNIITSLLGAPVVMSIILNRKFRRL